MHCSSVVAAATSSSSYCMSLLLLLVILIQLSATRQTSAMSTNQQQTNEQKQLAAKQQHQPKNQSSKGRMSSSKQNRSSPIVRLSKNSPQYSNPLKDFLDPYRNEPPVFLTATRDFVVDVAKAQAGKRVTIVQASDGDDDKLEFQLKPSPIRDASPYFTINSTSGELRLSGMPFKYRMANGSDDTEAEADDEGEEVAPATSNLTANYNATAELEQNLYFLNVAVNDGHYLSVVELNIRVTNSTLMKLREAEGVQLEDESDADSKVKSLQAIMREKTREFYAQLNQMLPHHQQVATNNNNNNSSINEYNFLNPGLTKLEESSTVEPVSLIGPAPLPTNPQTELQYQSASGSATQTTTTLPLLSSPPQMPTAPTASSSFAGLRQASGGAQAISEHHSQPPTTTEPMMMNLIMIMCSCLMIALVLLMFIIPLSVKKLRKRLRHVELQHESLSQKTSNVSSIIGSSLNSTSAHLHNHHPSLSEFTLSSSNGSGTCTQRGTSSVFRQSSLDSARSIATMSSHHPHHHQFNRIDNGSIANPMYLHQQNRPPYNQRTMYDFKQPTDMVLRQQHQHHMYGLQAAHENVYYPLSDEFYSTIQTDTTPLGDNGSSNNITNAQQIQGFTSSVSNYQMTQCPQPTVELEGRPLDSPDSTASSPALRSLTRFLSLPARNLPLEEGDKTDASNSSIRQLEMQLGSGAFSSTTMRPYPNQQKTQQHQQQINARTIARTCNVDREQPANGAAGWELERHRLRIPWVLLDEGQFGQVWRCKLSGLGHKQPDRLVAVKSVKKNASNSERGREELLAEIEIMKLVCDHPNVVKLLHCCTKDDKPILLVMEYMEQGKLQSYLEKSRKNHHYSTSPFTAPDDSSSSSSNITTQQHHQLLPSDYLTSRDLMKFIYHVAKGMEYISSKCIVHRDIASRNILVSRQKICKIGDFGMARHMQSIADVYERHSGNCKIPVRWMAPEVLLSNSFTTKSDVFSFGILMWEIITLGSTPYTHLKTEQVIDRVARNGERPERPDYCHPQLYEIMSRCWQHEPAARPSFKELVDILGELVLSTNNYIELDQYPDHDYYNIPKTAAPDELL